MKLSELAKKAKSLPDLDFDWPGTEGPTVIVANNDDGHYWQGFESWAELRAFIRDLEKAGQEAFGIEQPK